MFVRPRLFAPNDAPSEEVGDGAAPSGASDDDATATGNAAATYESALAALPEAQREAILGEVRKKNSEAKNLRDRVKSLEPKAKAHEDAQEAQRTAEERAEARAAAAEERAAAATRRAAEADARSLAADRFADPSDVARFVDMAKFIGQDGEIDEKGLTAELDDLLATKPYLGKVGQEQTSQEGQQNGQRRRPAPDPSQASAASGRGTPAPSVQTGAELYRARKAARTSPAVTT